MYYVNPIQATSDPFGQNKMLASKHWSFDAYESNFCFRINASVTFDINGRLPNSSLMATFWCNYAEIANVAFYKNYEKKVNNGWMEYKFSCYINIPLANTSYYRTPFAKSQVMDLVLFITLNQVAMADYNVKFNDNIQKDQFAEQLRTEVHKTYRDVQNNFKITGDKKNEYELCLNNFNPLSQEENDYIYCFLNNYDPSHSLFKYLFTLKVSNPSFNRMAAENAKMQLEYSFDENPEKKVLNLTPELQLEQFNAFDYRYRFAIKEWVSYDEKRRALTASIADKGGIFIDRDCTFTIKLSATLLIGGIKRFITFERTYRTTYNEANSVKSKVGIKNNSEIDMKGLNVENVKAEKFIQ